MRETRFDIIKKNLGYLSSVERLLIKSILFFYKDLIISENEDRLLSVNDPVIYAFNHNNYWETILVSFYLIFRRNGKKISFVIDWMYGQLPILRWLFNKIDPVYVYNKNAKIPSLNHIKKVSLEQKAYKECLARLKQQQSIGIFPEGTRNKNPHFLKRGRKGVGAMVLASGAAVVPIGIRFPQRPNGGGLSPLRTMTLRIGTPLFFPTELAVARQISEDQTLSPQTKKRWAVLLAAHVTHHVMEALASLSGKRYPHPAPEALPDELQHPKILEALCPALKPARY
jgi:1-acyl-sn-glycerol-3-phosphate acyltransferase